MNLLLLTNHLNFGGISVYLLNLCRGLQAKEGMRIYVASRGGGLEKDFINQAGAGCVRIPLTTKCEVSPKVLLSFLKLRLFVAHHGIDLIHANTRVTQVLAALLSRATGVPYLSTCHGYFKARLSRRLFPCWGRRVIAISDRVRDHLIRDFHLEPSRVEVIHNGVDLERFPSYSAGSVEGEIRRLGLAPDKKIVGHIGRLSSVKGQKFLVLAAQEVLKKRRDAQFLIIGDGAEERELRSLVLKKGLEKYVFIRSSTPNTALALSTMDVFCMPSLQEGLGISILEAQAAGVPVVASRVGGIPEIVEDGATGLLAAPADARGLATAILRFLDDPGFRDAVVAKARKQVEEKFSASLMAEKTERLYMSMLR